jgi:tRNA-splicing ligase RtcB
MVSEILQKKDLIKINDYTYEIPTSYRSDMVVPARFYANEEMMQDLFADRALWQLVNMTTLPGIQRYAFGMPDIHQGYGFPIGGVAASAIDEGGIISPGGIGYDINCGVRLLTVNISATDLKPYLEKLATSIFNKVPSGVGRGGKLKFKRDQIDAILQNGAHHMVDLEYGNGGDLMFCEENGRMDNADPEQVSFKAKERGADQIGTLGSGNHFLEIQAIDKVYNKEIADVFGLHEGMVTIMIHCGSRGLGHQTCTDYLRIINQKSSQWNYTLPDRELMYAPFLSQEGQNYFTAMSAAANFAWANRHMIGHWVRQACEEVVSKDIVVTTMYDVSHNMGKIETHEVNGISKKLLVHRKGATRAFGPGREEIVSKYKDCGQPVLIPGTMGTASYVLVGTKESMGQAFGTSCHGAGRRMSRMQAKKTVRGSQLREELESRGIIIRSDSDPGLAEEAPIAYKDVDNVVDVVQGAHLADKVVRLIPLAVVKGG